MTSDWGKENYLVLDWSIESLEGRCKYLDESGILQDLSETERRKSKLAKAQLNMITTYLFRSKDVKSGRKVDDSYYVDDSSYFRSLKTSKYMDNIDIIPDDDDEEYDISDGYTNKDSGKDDEEKDDELDSDSDDDLETYLDLDLETEKNYEEYEEYENTYSENDDADRYISGIEDEQDDYYEKLLHIEKLFDPKNIDHTVLRKIVTTYKDIKDIEFDNDIVKYNIAKIMESVFMCVDNDDDNRVIELLMQDMTEREISDVMNVSRQSVNKRIRKIFRKTIKLLKN